MPSQARRGNICRARMPTRIGCQAARPDRDGRIIGLGGQMSEAGLPFLNSCRARQRLASALGALAICAMAGAGAAGAETVTIGNSLAESKVLLALCKPCTVFQSAQPGATRDLSRRWRRHVLELPLRRRRRRIRVGGSASHRRGQLCADREEPGDHGSGQREHDQDGLPRRRRCPSKPATASASMS